MDENKLINYLQKRHETCDFCKKTVRKIKFIDKNHNNIKRNNLLLLCSEHYLLTKEFKDSKSEDNENEYKGGGKFANITKNKNTKKPLIRGEKKNHFINKFLPDWETSEEELGIEDTAIVDGEVTGFYSRIDEN